MKDEVFVGNWIDSLYKIVEDYDVSGASEPKEYLRWKAEQMVDDISNLWTQLEPYKDEQWCLCACDKLNEVSVRY